MLTSISNFLFQNKKKKIYEKYINSIIKYVTAQNYKKLYPIFCTSNLRINPNQ